MNKILRITKCSECPHIDEDGLDPFSSLCLHEDAPKGSGCCISDYPEIPDWCPLEEEQIW